jgi:hypothetical protein
MLVDAVARVGGVVTEAEARARAAQSLEPFDVVWPALRDLQQLVSISRVPDAQERCVRGGVGRGGVGLMGTDGCCSWWWWGRGLGWGCSVLGVVVGTLLNTPVIVGSGVSVRCVPPFVCWPLWLFPCLPAALPPPLHTSSTVSGTLRLR